MAGFSIAMLPGGPPRNQQGADKAVPRNQQGADKALQVLENAGVAPDFDVEMTPMDALRGR